MHNNHEALCDASLGKFDPADARRLMEWLEEVGIPYELDIELKPKWGNAHHGGSSIAILVPEHNLQEGNRLASMLFPPESESPPSC